jgi:autotransporter-associated beta strand protein
VLIDVGLPAVDILIQAMTGTPEIVRLGPGADPLHALEYAVRTAGAHASSVHLFSHGRPGVLELSAGEIGLETLARGDRRLDELRRMLAGRPLTLYGCSVGGGDAGRRFVEALSLALDAPVLASSTPTGAAARGGDWMFDVAAGGRADMVPALLDPERAALWPGLLTVDVTSTLGDASAGTLQAAAAAVDQTVNFNNLGAGATITLAASPTFTNGAATSFNFTGTTTSLTIGGADIIADSHIYFRPSAGQTMTINSGISFSAGARILATQGGGTVALNGSVSGANKIWVLGGTTAEIGTTTSAPLIDIEGNSTVRFTTSGAYTSNIEIENTATIDTGANNVTISGSVTDDGTNALVKSGTGTLTLSGTNTASGSMTLNQGTLSVAADGNLSAGTVTINGGTLAVTGATTIDNAIALGASNGTINVGANVTMSGVVSGAGNLTKTGASTLTLSGTNTYTGTTTVSGGTLSVSTDSNLGTGNVTLSGGGLAVTGATTIDNDISGTGSLTKSGTGTVILSGTNTYSGGTTVNGGTLQVSGGSALADGGSVTVSSGATLDLNGTSETIGSLSGSGTLNIGTGTLTLTDSASTNFSGTISGTGTIAGGGTYTVASGATLGGTSTFSTAVTVASGGTIAPGNSPGKISTGNLTLASGSTANMEIEGTAAGTGYDQIAVTGTVTISGATLSLTVTDIPSAGATYVLIDNDGVDAVTGTFSGLAEGASITAGGATYTISYAGGTGNDVVLTLPATPVASIDDGVMSGSEGDDRLVGGSTADHIRVFGGNDTVTANAGDDTISGGAGDDLLYGNDGADLIYGNQDADILYGNTGQDTIYGGQGADRVYGGQGNDVVCGNRGDDSLWGNLGADTLRAGDGNDLLYGNHGADSLQGEGGNDTLYGGQDADLLDGGAGNDSLCGNLGADTLSGGAGADTLVGGAGGDLFRFGDGDSVDTIQDFTIGEDLIGVSAGINGTGIASAADMLARVTSDGTGNAVLDLADGNSVTLIGVAPAQLDAASFLIV